MKFMRLVLPIFAVLVLLAGCAKKEPPVFQLIQLLQQGKYDDTIALAERLTAANPDDSEAHRFLVRAAIKKNELEKYREKYEQLVQQNPQAAGYHFGLGYLYVQLGDFEKGLAELQKANELNPSLEYVNYVIGWVNVNSKFDGADKEKGLAAWKKEEQLNPKSLGALQVYSDRANYYLRTGDMDAAEKDYEKITIYAFAPQDIAGAKTYISQIRTLRDELARLEADVKDKPDDAEARMQLGILQYKNGKIDEAIATWTNAVELAPDNVEIRNYLGKALLEKEKYAEAAEHFQKAVKLDPNMPTAYYNLAVAQEYLGQVKPAIENYKKYIEMNPMAPKLDEVKQRISTLESSSGAHPS